MLAVSAPPSRPPSGSLPASPSRSFLSKSPSPRRLLSPADNTNSNRNTPSPRQHLSHLQDDVLNGGAQAAMNYARKRSQSPMPMHASISPTSSPANAASAVQKPQKLSLPGIHDLLPDHVFEAQQREQPAQASSKARINPEPFKNLPSIPISIPRTPVASYTLASSHRSYGEGDAEYYGRHASTGQFVPSDSPSQQQQVGRYTHEMNTSFTFPRLPAAPISSQRGSHPETADRRKDRRRQSIDANSAAAHLFGLTLSASEPPTAVNKDTAIHLGEMDVDIADPGPPASKQVPVPPRSSTDPEEDEDEEEDDELAGDDNDGEDGVHTAPTSVDSHASKPQESGSDDVDQMDVETAGGNASSTENAGGSAAGGEDGKRHACAHCAKRFNRPSSLRIHLNTHTGAKPFECPFPGCGRQFNVSSNMRRHYRNHSSPANFPSTISSSHLMHSAATVVGSAYANAVPAAGDPRMMHVPLPHGTRLVPQVDARMRPQYHLPFQLQPQRMDPLAEHVMQRVPHEGTSTARYSEGMGGRHRHARSMPNAHLEAYGGGYAPQGMRIARRYPQSPSSLDLRSELAERDRLIAYENEMAYRRAENVQSLPQTSRAPSHMRSISPIAGSRRANEPYYEDVRHDRRLHRVSSEQIRPSHNTPSLVRSSSSRALHQYSPSLDSLPQRELLPSPRSQNGPPRKERYAFLQSPPIVSSNSLPSAPQNWRGHAHTHSAPTTQFSSRLRTTSDVGSSLTLPPIRDPETISERRHSPFEGAPSFDRSQHEKQQALREVDGGSRRLRCDSTSARTGHDSESDEDQVRSQLVQPGDVEMFDVSARENDSIAFTQGYQRETLPRHSSSGSREHPMTKTVSTISDATEIATLSAAASTHTERDGYSSPRILSSRAISRERSHSVSYAPHQTHSRAGSSSSSGHGHGHHPYALARHAHSRSRDVAFSPIIPPQDALPPGAAPSARQITQTSSVSPVIPVPSISLLSPSRGPMSMPIRSKRSVRVEEDSVEGHIHSNVADPNSPTVPQRTPSIQASSQPRSSFPSYTFPPPKPPAGVAISSPARSHAD